MVDIVKSTPGEHILDNLRWHHHTEGPVKINLCIEKVNLLEIKVLLVTYNLLQKPITGFSMFVLNTLKQSYEMQNPL